MQPPTPPARPEAPDSLDRWGSEDAAERYANARWRSAQARDRDERLVHALLARVGALSDPGRPLPDPGRPGGVLDVPSGTGRLRSLLSGLGLPYVAVDAALAMLAQDRPSRVLQASVHELPFRDDSFELVVCCRLLHHLREEATVAAAVRELVRVSGAWVIASFWDAASLHAWRRRRGLRAQRPLDSRVSISKRLLSGVFGQAGAEVVAFRHSLRFVSQQTFLLARKSGRR